MNKNKYVVVDPVSSRKIIITTTNTIKFDNMSAEDVEWHIEEYVEHDDLNAIRERASVDELLAFANDIRRVGGSNDMLHELIPSTPTDSSACLIANALNFQSQIQGSDYGDQVGENLWEMTIENEAVANAIEVSDLNLQVFHNYNTDSEELYDDDGEFLDETEVEVYYNSSIILPLPIGHAASAFDSFCDYELEKFNANAV